MTKIRLVVIRKFLRLLGNCLHDPSDANYAALGRHIARNYKQFVGMIQRLPMMGWQGLQISSSIEKHIERKK